MVALERKNEVIRMRGEWAEQKGLDKETFEQIFQCLVDSNIKKELEILDSRMKPA